MENCPLIIIKYRPTVMIQSFQTDRSGQTAQTKIRLLLEEQSDQGLHCLPVRLHLLGTLFLTTANFSGVRILGLLWYSVSLEM